MTLLLQDNADYTHPDSVVEEQTAIRGLYRALTFRIPDDCGGDYEGVLRYLTDDIELCLMERVGMGAKFYIGCSLDMKQMTEDEIKVRGFNSEASVVLRSTEVDELVKKHIALLIEQVDVHVRDGSGWFCTGVRSVDLFIARLIFFHQYDLSLTFSF